MGINGIGDLGRLRMKRTVLTHAGFTFNPVLLGIGLEFAGFLIFVKNSSPLATVLGAEQMTLLTLGCLTGILCACVLLMLGKTVRPASPLSSPMRAHVISAKMLIGAGVVLAGAGLGLYGVIPFAGGVLLGAGFCLVAAEWCVRYFALTPQNALLHSALALALGSVLYPSYALFGIGEVSAIFAFVLLVLSAAAALFSTERTDGIAQSAEPTGMADNRLSIHDFLDALWKPLLSGMLAALIMGLTYDSVASGASHGTMTVAQLYLHSAVSVVGVAGVIAAMLYRPKSFTLHIFIDAVMPAAIAVLLVTPFFNAEVQEVVDAQGFITQVCFAIIALSTWMSITDGARTTGATVWTIFSVVIALVTLTMCLGMGAIYLIGTGGQSLCLILLTLFLVLIIIDFARRNKPQETVREFSKDVFERFLTQRCSDLAHVHGLSAREHEILLYLARGYGHVYIARELYISENTVRTHAAHIYRKLEISSREAIIQLIHQ
jgi:DNA-binding CsgD family transcriptional regulator